MDIASPFGFGPDMPSRHSDAGEDDDQKRRNYGRGGAKSRNCCGENAAAPKIGAANLVDFGLERGFGNPFLDSRLDRLWLFEWRRLGRRRFGWAGGHIDARFDVFDHHRHDMGDIVQTFVGEGIDIRGAVELGDRRVEPGQRGNP